MEKKRYTTNIVVSVLEMMLLLYCFSLAEKSEFYGGL